MNLPERLKLARGEMSQAALAKTLGVTRSTVNQWESGETRPTGKNLRKLAVIRGFGTEWLETGRGPKGAPGRERVPIEVFEAPDDVEPPPEPAGIPEWEVRPGMGSGGLVSGEAVRRGDTVDLVKPERWQFPSTFIREELRAPVARLVVLETQGDSMTPTIQPGERVLVDTGHKLPTPDGIYALRDRFGAVVIKRLQMLRNPPVLGGNPPVLRVISDNPAHETESVGLDEVELVGRVVGGWKRY
jgi:phage repressor protein C with HTH and peptisase S24 domain